MATTWLRLRSGVALFCLAGLLTGCQALRSDSDTPRVQERITGFEQVEGQWEGLIMQRMPNGQEDGPIVLVVKKGGSYRFLDQHSIDPGLGSGTFTINDGQLLSQTPDRTVTATLYERGKLHFMDVDVTLKQGERFHFDMRRAVPGRSPLSPSSPTN